MNINQLLTNNELVNLIQEDNFVGWIYSIDYDKALVITNDLWKANVKGIPHNCFLIASSFNPNNFSEVNEIEREVILLRVTGSASLPQDQDIIRLKVDFFQNRDSKYDENPDKDFDRITKNMMQFSGLQCSVLGTFYMKDSELYLGSDIESFAASSKINVYRPTGKSLETIVNYVDPIKMKKAKKDAKEMGIKKPLEPFQLGTVRYTSTDRLHRSSEQDKVPFKIQPFDLLARRTGVLGMTRTGKSNMIKQTVAVVKRVSKDGDVNIGQLIYDINGEYANANKQDEGAISEVYPEDTIRYRMIKSEGFEELQNNFYKNIPEGFNLIREKLEEDKISNAADISIFKNASFDEPEGKFNSEHKRWEVKKAAYLTMLYKAGYEVGDGFRVKFLVKEDIRNFINEQSKREFKNPKYGLNLEESYDWFMELRKRDIQEKKTSFSGDKIIVSSSGKDWVDDELGAILNLLACKNSNDSFITGYKLISNYKKYHSSRRDGEVGEEIFNHLKNGKIIIIDLSVGDATLREKISKQIARDVFNKSMNIFINGQNPPNVVIYVEEAHNLIGKSMELTETWPKLAKEGAKYKISLVYATQEVSSIHPNILANTENWIISHLNNVKEISELAKFYDFDDFSKSLIRAQDVGFSRIKTLSSPYVVPVQIDLFKPDKELEYNQN